MCITIPAAIGPVFPRADRTIGVVRQIASPGGGAAGGAGTAAGSAPLLSSPINPVFDIQGRQVIANPLEIVSVGVEQLGSR